MGPMRAGVVGAGTMGADIAEVLALAGCDVVLQSRRAEARERFQAAVARHHDRSVRRGRMTLEERDMAVARARTTDDYRGFADRDIVIEAVVEELPVKVQVLRTVEGVCRPETVVASTTSSLTIGELADAAVRPERVLGLHFFNPVRIIQLVEVITTPLSAAERVVDAMLFLKMIGRTPLRVRDCVGFLVNRLLFPAAAEGCRAYTEHAATPAEIDSAFLDWGMLVGPCAMLDMVGLDVALAISRNCERTLGRDYGPPPLLERCVAAGRLGRKSGLGIYAYRNGRPEPDTTLDAMRSEVEREHGVSPHTRFTVERLIVPLVNEAIACLAEGIASARDIDRAITQTIGMPEGPLAYVARLGRDTYLAHVERLCAEFGPRFALPPSLVGYLEAEAAAAAS
jgi:3-hydroxyacyl-CoA dehydrogenase/enoyl-CoA hydratase/3-hydroxybutyryl-CoA epimerase